MSEFKLFFFELIKGISIPFTGDTIKPFQIMGMLESRSLDFEHIIVLSCNEGKLPQAKNMDTIIPFDIRLYYELPTYRETDSAYSYTFYRLFHKAQDIHLIHTTPHAIPNQSSPRSRFLLQIENDFSELDTVKLNYEQMDFSLPVSSAFEPKVKKTARIIGLFRDTLQQGLSPTDIIAYLTDPLEFFYHVVLGLKRPYASNDELNQMTFGVLVHDTLKHLFYPLKGKEVSQKDIHQLLSLDIEGILFEKGKTILGKVNFERGRNYVLLQSAKKIIIDFLHQQKKQCPFVLFDLENYKASKIMWEDTTVQLIGKPDRIDYKNGILHLIDYKTGVLEQPFSATNAEDILYNKKYKLMQLLSYKYLLVKDILDGNLTEQLKEPIDELRVESGVLLFGWKGKAVCGLYTQR